MFLLIFKHHWLSIASWCRANDAQTHLDPDTWVLTVRKKGVQAAFQARFVTQKAGDLAYTHVPGDDNAFVGWFEPATSRMALARDKLEFKQTALNLGLRVPAAWNHGEALCSHVLIKQRQGSFGRGITGPWNIKTDAPVLPGDLTYFEQFIPGVPLKAWVFEGQVLALEQIDPPFLVGDGQRTIAELGTPRGSMDKPLPLDEAADYLRWQGWALDDVLPVGRKAWLSYLYRSSFSNAPITDPDCWSDTQPAVRVQLQTAALRLWHSLPTIEQKRRIFTLDAVLDQDNRVWFLEANSHPMIHPNVYPALLGAVFGEHEQNHARAVVKT